MADIRPFMAVRPAENLEKEIASLPYDVFSRAEAKEEVKDKPLSFLNIDRAETNLPDDIDTYDDLVYEKAKELFEGMKENGSFIKEDKPCFYLYEQTMDNRSQLGLVCTVSASEYESGIIKKHENTRADKEIDRIRHVDALSAQTGPIFLAYRDKEEISLFLKNITARDPYFDFVSGQNVRQRGWIIFNEDEIAFLNNAFKDVKNLYIADGHHRCASAAKVCKKRREEAGASEEKEYDRILSVLFPDSELMILDYNRVVKTLNGLSENELLDKISDSFDITEKEYDESKPGSKGEIFMLLGDKEYILTYKGKLSKDPVKSLDVSILQDYILDPILGIKDPKTDPNIDFVGGIRGIKELKRRMSIDGKVAFSMYPTQMDELFSVADAGLLMPPKSTWFEPKLLSGLFIHEI